MMSKVDFDHEESGEKGKIVLEVEPESNKPRKKNLRLREPLYL